MAPSEPIEPIVGSVAKIEDQHTLILNRGSNRGVELGMIFAVLADDAEVIIDPENGEEIGRLPKEKLRVRVTDVHEKYSRAETYRTYTYTPQPLASSKGIGGIGALGTSLLGGNLDPGGINSILGEDFGKRFADSGALSSLNEAISAEMSRPRTVRQKIANADPPTSSDEPPLRREVTVDIGDKVRQVMGTVASPSMRAIGSDG